MIHNTEIITKEFCRGKILLFRPKTDEEAEFIQRQLFKLGYGWTGEPDQKCLHVHNCVVQGMILKNGRIYFRPSPAHLAEGFLCTSKQFSERFKPKHGFESRMEKLKLSRPKHSTFVKKPPGTGL